MSGLVLLLATLHEFQGSGFHGFVEDESYANGIRSRILTRRADFVFEEAGGRSPSIAKSLADSLLGPVHYLDVDVREREPNPLLRPKPVCGFSSIDVGESQSLNSYGYEG